MDRVDDFLAGDGQVMLVLGDSGAGKSTFGRHLEHQLWQEYQPGSRIPLFISLSVLDRPHKDLVAEYLKRVDFPEDLIWELKQRRQLLLICDGYDEGQLTCNLHTTNLFSQSRQWDVKLLITCRTQYLGPDYHDRFVPMAAGRYHQFANNLFHEAVIAPFSEDQIEMHLEKSLQLEARTFVKKDFKARLSIIPDLLDLGKNPFILTVVLEALSYVFQEKSDLSSLCVSRLELYETFVQHWLAANKRRLQNLRLNKCNRAALEALLDDGFQRNGTRYHRELAMAIFQEQGGQPDIDYSHMQDSQTWKARYFGTDPIKCLLRDSSLLIRAGNQYHFVNQSVLAYFFSCAIWEFVTQASDFGPQADSDPDGALFSIGDHPLSRRNLNLEPSVIRFLAERVQKQPAFKQHLFALIELSKSDTQATQAAANATTVLIRAGVRFHDTDSQWIRMPEVGLLSAQLKSAHFRRTAFMCANFSKAWLEQMEIGEVLGEKIRLGGLPKRTALPTLVVRAVYSSFFGLTSKKLSRICTSLLSNFSTLYLRLVQYASPTLPGAAINRVQTIWWRSADYQALNKPILSEKKIDTQSDNMTCKVALALFLRLLMAFVGVLCEAGKVFLNMVQIGGEGGGGGLNYPSFLK
jgi:hypothetical protein